MRDVGQQRGRVERRREKEKRREKKAVVRFKRRWTSSRGSGPTPVRNRVVHGTSLLSLEETVGWSELYLADAVSSVRHGLVVESVVFLDYASKVLVSYTSLLFGLFSLDIGEALAILRSLRLAIDLGYFTVCVESDVAFVVKQLSSRVISCYDIGLILDDILALVVGFLIFPFRLFAVAPIKLLWSY
ncbi:hypothetical protein ACOSQ3_029565 [Xanthoceras sorbifolium]